MNHHSYDDAALTEMATKLAEAAGTSMTTLKMV